MTAPSCQVETTGSPKRDAMLSVSLQFAGSFVSSSVTLCLEGDVNGSVEKLSHYTLHEWKLEKQKDLESCP